MAKHPVRVIEYHTLHDSGGYTDHPNPNRAPVVPVVNSLKLNGRHEVAPPKRPDAEATTPSIIKKK